MPTQHSDLESDENCNTILGTSYNVVLVPCHFATLKISFCKAKKHLVVAISDHVCYSVEGGIQIFSPCICQEMAQVLTEGRVHCTFMPHGWF